MQIDSELAAELDALATFATIDRLPYALGAPLLHGTLRAVPADFQVVEVLPFKPSGFGEHQFIKLRKTGQNTRWVAGRLAHYAGVKSAAVSYAGLKDRHAVTSQWFSVHLPGIAAPDWAALRVDGVELLAQSRHQRKLRTGQLNHNEFKLRITGVTGTDSALDQRLQRICEQGAPNYFGPQRFGHSAGNLYLLAAARVGREDRAFGISALRSALFNGYLAQRLEEGSWAHCLSGESAAEAAGPDLEAGERDVIYNARVPIRQRGPVGPLWGLGSTRSADECLRGEEKYFGQFPRVTHLLAQYDAGMGRRSLVCRPVGLKWEFGGGILQLEFALNPGAYATTVLREVLHAVDADRYDESGHSGEA